MALESALPNYIIPEGTHVVLKVDKKIPRTEAVKPTGTVALVVRSPVTNRYSYTIEFTDGSQTRAKYAELAMRRREVGEDLITPAGDFREFVIYKCIVGSKAYGLGTAESDDDIRGIYLPPAALHWSLYKAPEQIEYHTDEMDEVYWELEKFLNLALRANPNVLEVLWSPIVQFISEVGQELLSLREAFLSKLIYKTYSGYVLSQFRKMSNALEAKGSFKPKHAMHLIRLLMSGIHALKTGDIKVDISEHRDELLRVKSGELSFEEVKAWALELDAEFQQLFTTTSLPDKPDYEDVNRFLVKCRRRVVEREEPG